jgi:DNA-binding response OmpR family regulator
MAEAPLRVLVVDDDVMQLRLVERTLRAEGFQVEACSNPIGVSNLVRSYVPDIVLLDVNIPALSGDRLLEIARRGAPPATRFILYSSSDATTLRGLAMRVGADGWISKDVVGAALATKLRQVARTPRPER